jgi:hypothetical protein
MGRVSGCSNIVGSQTGEVGPENDRSEANIGEGLSEGIRVLHLTGGWLNEGNRSEAKVGEILPQGIRPLVWVAGKLDEMARESRLRASSSSSSSSFMSGSHKQAPVITPQAVHCETPAEASSSIPATSGLLYVDLANGIWLMSSARLNVACPGNRGDLVHFGALFSGRLRFRSGGLGDCVCVDRVTTVMLLSFILPGIELGQENSGGRIFFQGLSMQLTQACEPQQPALRKTKICVRMWDSNKI